MFPLLVTFALSLALCAPARPLLRRLGIIDQPNARSSHSVPTVRGLGVGIVEAAARLRAQGSTARFVLAGDTDAGNPAAIPEATLRGWQNAGTVEWLGHRDDMPELMRQASIVCLPSYREGMPRVLIEAAACGRAIVTTNVPGCRDVVRDGVSGLLVPPRDPAALSTAMGRLLDDPPLRRRMGAAGRALVEEECSMESVIAATLSVYNELLKGPA